jgi:DNA-binding transcriptional ArsR family regulator
MLNYKDMQGTISAPPVDMKSLAEQLKALAEPRRLLIFHLLMEGVTIIHMETFYERSCY